MNTTPTVHTVAVIDGLSRCRNCHAVTWKFDECPMCRDGRVGGEPVTEHVGLASCDPGNCAVEHYLLFAPAGLAVQ